MKRIIKKKCYDTDTATAVASANNGLYMTNFYVQETLYRKKTGEFFLHGCGGSMTEYGDYKYGCWCSGERIIPITEKSAKVWATAFCDADTYIALFGKGEE